MRRYQSMVDWWSTNGPPVYIAVAGYLGLIKEPVKKVDGKPQPVKREVGNLNDLLKMAGAGGIIH